MRSHPPQYSASPPSGATAKRCPQRTRREPRPSSERRECPSADRQTSYWAWWLHRNRLQPVAARPSTGRKEKRDQGRESSIAKQSPVGHSRRLPERTLLMQESLDL